MSSHQKSRIQTGKFVDIELPTAAKTNYQEVSRYINTSNLKSPSRYQQKIQGVRQSISQMISQMGTKRNQNNDALNHVRSENAEALRVLREQANNFANYTPKKPQRVSYQRQNRPIVEDDYKSQIFQPQPQIRHNEFSYQPDYRPAQNNYYGSPINYQANNQNKSLEQQNLELRRALNEQIRINKELVKRINQLQYQNSDLKSQLHQNNIKPLQSTRYGTNSYGGDTDLNLSGRLISPTRFPNQTYLQGSYSPAHNIKQNNQRYTQNFNNQGYGGNNFDNNQYSSLFAQLDYLKRENESLRQNTINLLRN